MLDPKLKVAVYMEDHIDSDYGKMGMGVVRYLKNPIVGVVDKTFAGKSMRDFMNLEREVPILKNLEAAIEEGAEVLILGIAPSGGRIPESWNSIIVEALEAGLSIVIPTINIDLAPFLNNGLVLNDPFQPFFSLF